MNKALGDRTINELRAEAKKKGIALRRSMNKGEILRALKKKARRSTSAAPSVAKTSPRKMTKGRARHPLPEEYDENDLLFIVVDPDVVYASWEIKKNDVPEIKGLKMRLYNVTESGPNDKPKEFYDIDIKKRVGSGFFDIGMNGQDIVAEIGHLKGRKFEPILRSNRVSFPLPLNPGEFGSEHKETDTPVGY